MKWLLLCFLLLASAQECMNNKGKDYIELTSHQTFRQDEDPAFVLSHGFAFRPKGFDENFSVDLLVAFTGGLKSKVDRSDDHEGWIGSFNSAFNAIKISFRESAGKLVGSVSMTAYDNDDPLDEEKEFTQEEVLAVPLVENAQDPIIVSFSILGTAEASQLSINSGDSTFTLSSAEEEAMGLIAVSLLDSFNVTDLSQLQYKLGYRFQLNRDTIQLGLTEQERIAQINQVASVQLFEQEGFESKLTWQVYETQGGRVENFKPASGGGRRLLQEAATNTTGSASAASGDALIVGGQPTTGGPTSSNAPGKEPSSPAEIAEDQVAPPKTSTDEAGASSDSSPSSSETISSPSISEPVSETSTSTGSGSLSADPTSEANSTNELKGTEEGTKPSNSSEEHSPGSPDPSSPSESSSVTNPTPPPEATPEEPAVPTISDTNSSTGSSSDTQVPVANTTNETNSPSNTDEPTDSQAGDQNPLDSSQPESALSPTNVEGNSTFEQPGSSEGNTGEQASETAKDNSTSSSDHNELVDEVPAKDSAHVKPDESTNSGAPSEPIEPSMPSEPEEPEEPEAPTDPTESPEPTPEPPVPSFKPSTSLELTSNMISQMVKQPGVLTKPDHTQGHNGAQIEFSFTQEPLKNPSLAMRLSGISEIPAPKVSRAHQLRLASLFGISSPLKLPLMQSFTSLEFQVSMKPEVLLSQGRTASVFPRRELHVLVYLQQAQFPFQKASNVIDFNFSQKALEHKLLTPIMGFDSYTPGDFDLVFELITSDDGVAKINTLLDDGLSLVLGNLIVKRLDGNLGSYPNTYCLSAQQKASTLVLRDRKAVDHGFTQKAKVKMQQLLSWSMTMFTIACGCISMGIVLGIRKRRNVFNISVLRESNQRLDGLLWVLNYSMNFLQDDEKDTSRMGLTPGTRMKLQKKLGLKKGLGAQLPAHQINTQMNPLLLNTRTDEGDQANQRNTGLQTTAKRQKDDSFSKRDGPRYNQGFDHRIQEESKRIDYGINFLRQQVEMKDLTTTEKKRYHSGRPMDAEKNSQAEAYQRAARERAVRLLLQGNPRRRNTNMSKSQASVRSFKSQQLKSVKNAFGIDSSSDADSESDSEEDSDEEDELFSKEGNSSSDEEERLQREVDNIIDSVMNLDLGDDRENKELKREMSKYQEENKMLTAQMSHRSKRSNRSFKSNFSRKTNKQSILGAHLMGSIMQTQGQNGSVTRSQAVIPREEYDDPPPANNHRFINVQDQTPTINLLNQRLGVAQPTQPAKPAAGDSGMKQQESIVNLEEANDFVNQR